MRLLVLMVVKNEADRYLDQALSHARLYADKVFVYDDQSDDSTTEIAKKYADVVVRPDYVPTFMKHEGRFRQAALDAMGPKSGDWVHVLDADEFLVTHGDVRERIEHFVKIASSKSSKALRVKIPTVWGGTIKDGYLCDPVVRVDKFWNTLAEPRIWQYQKGAKFLDKAMACRNEPTYVRRFPILETDLVNFHYGYAFSADRLERYKRYSSLKNHGHNPRFIESINTAAPVKAWSGPWMPIKVPSRA